MAGAIAQGRQRCQFPFLVDEKPTFVPGGSAGERSGGAKDFLWRRSLEFRASDAVGLRWQAVFGCLDYLLIVDLGSDKLNRRKFRIGASRGTLFPSWTNF